MASTPEPTGQARDAATGGEGEYEVADRIRDGWGGTLYAGSYRRSGRRVTVEEIRPDLTATPGFVDRLGELGRAATAVRDPHVLAVYDLVDSGDGLRLVAEWSEAGTLAAAVASAPLQPERAVAVVAGVLDGLAALHGHGLFHGRVAPETVVVEADGRARLAELAVCAAGAPPGAGPVADVRAAARLGTGLLGATGAGLGAVRDLLEAVASGARQVDARTLRAELDAAGAAGPAPAAAAVAAPPPRRRRRRRLLIALAVLIVLAAAAAGILALTLGSSPVTGGHPAPLAVGSDATLSVSPSSGGCNTTFGFIARGSLSGVGTLVYRWEQSDGQVTSDASLPISASEGAFELTEAWRLQGSQTVNGTMTLHIEKPVDRRISQSFRYSCP